MDPKYLLLQARVEGDPVAQHELDCFVESLDVSADAITTHDLLSGPPELDQFDDKTLLLVGGSGDFSTLDNYPWVHQFIDFLRDEVVGKKRPAFCSCFGFQGLVLAGGGDIVQDAQNTEVGTYTLFATDAAADDPLMSDLGASFTAQLGHKDRASRLPSGVVNLAYSERCPYQAFRLPGTHIVATQFHPELSREANLHRYLRYREAYAKSGGDPGDDAVVSSMADSIEATALLPRWAQACATSPRP